MLTRRQRILQAEIAAQNLSVQSIVFIRNDHQLYKFANAAFHNQLIACGTKSLHISLNTISADSMQTLKQLLFRTSAITDLTLLFPISPSNNILRNLRFRNLYLFKTNIPHRAVEGFLRRHPRIEHLDLGPCDIRTREIPCPLVDVALPSLWDLACPPACTIALQASDITRARVLHHSVQDAGVPTFRVLGGMLSSAATLTVLQLDFDPSEFGLLRCVANVAPLLTALKLIEKHQAQPPRVLGKISARREWNDHRSWARDLRLLPHLAVLLLKTSTSLVLTPGDLMQEARLVNRWAGAEDTRHPHLHHLALWCLSKKDSGHLSLWDLRGGKWTQTQALDGCMEDAEDMETMFS